MDEREDTKIEPIEPRLTCTKAEDWPEPRTITSNLGPVLLPMRPISI